ncbi:hypothetical protein IDJ77_10210 [Mucilaginibacter sp. ZT4R22]|uniref:Outer membrane protein beta-barrel domain-containing protein n=1 Tax=Mucilaginibacter pankratovii TaxID=2772110 RepID=A0ABR7WPG3_9SPHI|nr:hypothetical protein [Mucilaginibacter pankratovii]MBD1364182.1 hypothetical protein [Mucilaginibacter pankratovii]
MKKILLAILFAGSTAATCLAQKNSDAGKFSIGLELGLPTDDGVLFATRAIGGSLKYDIPISTGTFFTLSSGYTSLRGKDGWPAVGFIPLKAGLKYYLYKGFYGEGQAGAVLCTKSGGGTGFVYAPGVGYSFPGGFDIGARYESWSQYDTISQVSLRLGFSF